MNIAYIVLAHKHPEQVKRLVEALNIPGQTWFFVHIDKKVPWQPFRSLLENDAHADLKFVFPRTKVYWADFSVVSALLSALKVVRTSGVWSRLDYIFFLSGQDYPVRSNSEIVAFLENNTGKEFIGYKQLPARFWSFGGKRRFEHFHFNRIPLRRYTKPLSRKFLPRRSFPQGFIPYGGSAWWCLTPSFVDYLFDFIDGNKSFVNFFKWVNIPDEMFIHTILLNSSFSEHVVGEIMADELTDPLRYVRWNNERPLTLKTSQFNELIDSGKLFARKFDSAVDSRILDMVDDFRQGGE